MMMLYENFRLALFSLKANKMRSLLTMLGIIIGVSSVIAIMSAGDSISAKLSDTMEGFGANNIQMYLDFRTDYDGDYYYDYSDLMNRDMLTDFGQHFIDRLKAISVTSEVGAADVKRDKDTAKVTLVGVTLGTFLIDDVKLTQGRFFTIGETDTAAKVAIVSSKYVDIMYGGKAKDALGESVTVEIDGKAYKFTIVGVYEYTPSLGVSTPPLKKNVTCAYFSVSAILACLSPLAASHSPNVFVTSTLWNATDLLGIVGSYSVKHTYLISSLFLSKPLKSSSQNALVISLARSGLKLKKMIESPSFTIVRGSPLSHTTVGTINSSVTPSSYDF